MKDGQLTWIVEIHCSSSPSWLILPILLHHALAEKTSMSSRHPFFPARVPVILEDGIESWRTFFSSETEPSLPTYEPSTNPGSLFSVEPNWKTCI